MILIEKTTVHGWEEAIRGMRNPMNSWEKSDSIFGYPGCDEGHNILGDEFSLAGEAFEAFTKFWVDEAIIGDNDLDLMERLAASGSTHAKYRRMITVYADITAPLYWWKEFDTYKVGTVANSCSTMHKIAAKEFTIDDFSHDHLLTESDWDCGEIVPRQLMDVTIATLNEYRSLYLKNHDKKYWWQLIQLLPSSYNQKRTVMLNYEVLAGIYQQRKNHKLDEWNDFCDWIKVLPYSELIINPCTDVCRGEAAKEEAAKVICKINIPDTNDISKYVTAAKEAFDKAIKDALELWNKKEDK